MKTMIYTKTDSIVTIIFNSPESLNAINDQFLTDFGDALDQVEKDKEARVLIVTGYGKAFIAGADIKSMIDMSILEARLFSNRGNKLLSRLETLKIPVIAAINGYALGGGLEVALACDVRIADKKAIFGLPEVKLGIMPGFGGTQRLSRIVGPSIAKEMIYTGRNVKADEAKAFGLVNQVCESDELMTKAESMADIISRNAPIGISQSKLAINIGLDLDINTAVRAETEIFSSLFATEDQKTGMRGFVKKNREIIFMNK